MTPADRIGRFLALAGIDRPAEKTLQTAKGKITVPVDLEPRELAIGYEAASQRLFALLGSAEQARDLTIASATHALLRAVDVGEFLLEVQELFAGEFDEWLEGYCAQRMHRATAYRYIKAVRYKDALRDACPDFGSLKELYIAAGILTPPAAGDDTGPRPPEPLFRLRCEINLDPDPATWEPLVRRDFIAKAEPIAALLTLAKQAEEAA